MKRIFVRFSTITYSRMFQPIIILVVLGGTFLRLLVGVVNDHTEYPRIMQNVSQETANIANQSVSSVYSQNPGLYPVLNVTGTNKEVFQH